MSISIKKNNYLTKIRQEEMHHIHSTNMGSNKILLLNTYDLLELQEKINLYVSSLEKSGKK